MFASLLYGIRPAYLQETFRDEFVAVFVLKVVFLMAAIETSAFRMPVRCCRDAIARNEGV